MIVSFRHKGLQRLHETGDRSKVAPDLVERARSVLAVLDVSVRPEDVERPSFRLHPLKGDRKGEWAVTVRANWRIVFRFEDGHVAEVDLVDYH